MPGNQRYIDADAVKSAVSILDVAQGYGLQLRREGREWRGLSPFKPERTPSFYVDPAKGLFKDFASGEGGDVIRLVQLMDACDFVTALRKLMGEAGLDDPADRERRARAYRERQRSLEERQAEATARRISQAASIWRGCEAAEGTLVETYLRARGIDIDAFPGVYGWLIPPMLKFHPAVRYVEFGSRAIDIVGPAMVGLAQREILGRVHPCGVHRTWLAPDGQGKAALPCPKKTMGQLLGASTVLSPVAEDCVLGEGFETALTVMAALARAGRRVHAVSGLFLGNITGAGIKRKDAPRDEISIVPDASRPGLMLPAGVRRLWLLKDADGKRPQDIDRHLRRAATKFQRLGLQVYVASPTLGHDFNDMTVREVA